MLEINEKTKIFMACPANVKTGGPELAHQLVNTLYNMGIEAYMLYIGAKKNIDPVNDEYKKYNNKYVTELSSKDISKNNILIVPEIYTYLIKKHYNNMQTAIWWMSVDNYIVELKCKGIKRKIKRILNISKGNHYKFEKDIKTYHLCQSYYAIDFLKTKGVDENDIFYLSDYLNDIYINMSEKDVKEKEDIVLYNPKKGYEYTKKIIDKCNDICFVPLQNMTSTQVREALLRAKVYIDFGNHPGKDRFPREAAMCGCCIITGKRGSAKYKEDVNIPEEFKFEDLEKNIEIVSNKIKNTLNNYDEESKKFYEYKKIILNEKDKFISDVRCIFKK
ncbi:MAG: hypothetical protein IJK18_02320 [Clostridia bacterium]|nr:hypothetical protein [Clostridia bacterium]